MYTSKGWDKWKVVLMLSLNNASGARLSLREELIQVRLNLPLTPNAGNENIISKQKRKKKQCFFQCSRSCGHTEPRLSPHSPRPLDIPYRPSFHSTGIPYCFMHFRDLPANWQVKHVAGSAGLDLRQWMLAT